MIIKYKAGLFCGALALTIIFKGNEIKTKDTYEMPFYINAVEIIKRRNKKNHKTRNFDSKHSTLVGWW